MKKAIQCLVSALILSWSGSSLARPPSPMKLPGTGPQGVKSLLAMAATCRAGYLAGPQVAEILNGYRMMTPHAMEAMRTLETYAPVAASLLETPAMQSEFEALAALLPAAATKEILEGAATHMATTVPAFDGQDHGLRAVVDEADIPIRIPSQKELEEMTGWRWKGADDTYMAWWPLATFRLNVVLVRMDLSLSLLPEGTQLSADAIERLGGLIQAARRMLKQIHVYADGRRCCLSCDLVLPVKPVNAEHVRVGLVALSMTTTRANMDAALGRLEATARNLGVSVQRPQNHPGFGFFD
jgi:hypothetical protein